MFQPDAVAVVDCVIMSQKPRVQWETSILSYVFVYTNYSIEWAVADVEFSSKFLC